MKACLWKILWFFRLRNVALVVARLRVYGVGEGIEGPENKYKQARTVHETPENQRKMRRSGGLGKMLFLNFIPGLQFRESTKYKTPPISLSPCKSPVGKGMDAALVTGHQASPLFLACHSHPSLCLSRNFPASHPSIASWALISRAWLQRQMRLIYCRFYEAYKRRQAGLASRAPDPFLGDSEQIPRRLSLLIFLLPTFFSAGPAHTLPPHRLLCERGWDEKGLSPPPWTTVTLATLSF